MWLNLFDALKPILLFARHFHPHVTCFANKKHRTFTRRNVTHTFSLTLLHIVSSECCMRFSLRLSCSLTTWSNECVVCSRTHSRAAHRTGFDGRAPAPGTELGSLRSARSAPLGTRGQLAAHHAGPRAVRTYRIPRKLMLYYYVYIVFYMIIMLYVIYWARRRPTRAVRAARPWRERSAPLSHGTNNVCTLTILFLVDHYYVIGYVVRTRPCAHCSLRSVFSAQSARLALYIIHLFVAF